jgi:geranylgeranyl diphosphate synthase type II
VNPTEAQSLAPSDLNQVIHRVHEHLRCFLESKQLPGNLHDSITYSLLGGGKRIRPALAWYSAIACGGSGESTLHAGCAVEMIHAFSLIHDDLPALDNDDMRRGRPTLHVHAGESMAILAGDALLSLAYESTYAHPDQLIALRLSEELSQGTRSMIVGQVYDTLGGFASGISDIDAVELIHRNKTGALLRASCRMGAIASGADGALLECVTQYSEAIGLQFQIIDDLLDVEGCTESVGKPLGKDAAAGKRTYPAAVGVEGSRSLAKELGEQAADALARLSEASEGDISGLRSMGMMLTHRRA